MNETQVNKMEETAHICSVQEDLDLGKNIKNYLKSTSRPDMEQELIFLLSEHKISVALPEDDLGKSVLKHQD